jgi:hypothetical protein
MPTATAPLFFPEALHSPGLWNDLGKTHHLTRKDFEWLGHVQLASQSLRSQQSPPMLAQKVLVSANNLPSTPLAGCFVLSATPDDNGEILYTPYGGLQRFDSRPALTQHLENRLDHVAEDSDLLACMAVASRKALATATRIQVVFEAIEGDVFEDQRTVILHNQRINDQALLDELRKLPTLASLLDSALAEALASAFPGLDQRQTQVNVYAAEHWTGAMSLSDAVLMYYRQHRWPTGQRLEFSHPKQSPRATDRQHWASALTEVAGNLVNLLSAQLDNYWNSASTDGTTRREFFSRVIRKKARVELLVKREADIISAAQSLALHQLIDAAASGDRPVTLETVRLWEREAHFVELAGSLMISHADACLYTPTHGLQVLKDYKDLKDTLLSKFRAAGHEDELYGLLSLDERSRFVGFDQPHVSGEVITGSVFKTLFDRIIEKQLHNLEYVLQAFRHIDRAVDVHALFDKGLDIRAMLGEQLLTLDSQGRWSTRPVLSGRQQPSAVRADTAAAFSKTFSDVEALISADFKAQPLASLALQRVYLENMKPRLAHALSVGVRGEASLRVLDSSLRETDRAIVETVFDPDHPRRNNRLALNGFRPDAYTLMLACSGQDNVLPLAHCVLLTERGGLDNENSGRAILWTPAVGLETFRSIDEAKRQLNRRLLDPRKRLALLENLSAAQRQYHQQYSLASLRLIDDNVLQRLSQSAIDHFLAQCEHLRSQNLTVVQKAKALRKQVQTAVDTNLQRAMRLARAVNRKQSLPAWLGMAAVDEQQLHLELLEQYRNSVTDDKDYLHGLQTLAEHVRQTLTSLLTARFAGQSIDPDHIEIIPDLALAGPAKTLTEFAMNHVNVAQGTGFQVGSRTSTALPEGLNEAAVRQLLLSLNLQSDFAKRVTDSLSEKSADADQRKQCFFQQLPWQLLQHAHALKLQQRLSASAFDLIWQVLDMPDAVARTAVQGAHAVVRPLELIKTTGAAAVKTLGLYLIGPGAGQDGPQTLYAPYHTGATFSEFTDEASVISAINLPGPLQDLILRRLPESEQSSFRQLFESTAGQVSEVTLASSPVGGNLLARLYEDNTLLLGKMLGSQSHVTGQPDWEAVKHLFSHGIKLGLSLLPGKLAYLQFLWHSFKDYDESAEALQDHHWKRALETFIAGSVQMVTLGRLSLEDEIVEHAASETTPVATPVVEPKLQDIRPTSAKRTLLQPFEASGVALQDLRKNPVDGTFTDPVTSHPYAPVAGKVYRVDKSGVAWKILNALEDGPSLLKTPSQQLIIDPDRHTVHRGKALSKMHNAYATSHEVAQVLNIEARGMDNIRANHPEKARMLVQAIDLARYYAFNSLHNMAQLRQHTSGTRLDRFLKRFFDLDSVDDSLLDKIKQAIVPICNALVDPDEDLMNTERFVVGSNKCRNADLIAFVIEQDASRTVHFTEKFFDQQLDWYKSSQALSEPFDVDGHSQASTLIHEFAHLFSKAVDIASLEARRPFSDLVTSATGYGAALKQTQEVFQREALSLATPKEELFARWNSPLQSWISLDSIPGVRHVGKEILKVTGSSTMAEAREAFLNPRNADVRVDTILRNADSIAFLICEMGRQLDPVPVTP